MVHPVSKHSLLHLNPSDRTWFSWKKTAVLTLGIFGSMLAATHYFFPEYLDENRALKLPLLGYSLAPALLTIYKLSGPKFYQPITPFMAGLNRPGFHSCIRRKADLDFLEVQGVTHLFSFGDAEHAREEATIHKPYWEAKGLVFNRMQTEDYVEFRDEDLEHIFFKRKLGVTEEKVLEFLRQIEEIEKLPGAKVALYCGAGVGRSGAFMTAYLMKYHKISLKEATTQLNVYYHKNISDELAESRADELLAGLREKELI